MSDAHIVAVEHTAQSLLSVFRLSVGTTPLYQMLFQMQWHCTAASCCTTLQQQKHSQCMCVAASSQVTFACQPCQPSTESMREPSVLGPFARQRFWTVMDQGTGATLPTCCVLCICIMSTWYRLPVLVSTSVKAAIALESVLQLTGNFLEGSHPPPAMADEPIAALAVLIAFCTCRAGQC